MNSMWWEEDENGYENGNEDETEDSGAEGFIPSEDVAQTTLDLLIDERESLTAQLEKQRLLCSLMQLASAAGAGVQAWLLSLAEQSGRGEEELDVDLQNKRLSALEAAIDEVEDDVAQIDRLGSEANLLGISLRAMLRQIRLLTLYDNGANKADES